jgi:hypothetical protein
MMEVRLIYTAADMQELEMENCALRAERDSLKAKLAEAEELAIKNECESVFAYNRLSAERDAAVQRAEVAEANLSKLETVSRERDAAVRLCGA